MLIQLQAFDAYPILSALTENSGILRKEKDYNKSTSLFSWGLEKEIIGSLIEVLEEKPVTSHELKLVIDYVQT